MKSLKLRRHRFLGVCALAVAALFLAACAKTIDYHRAFSPSVDALRHAYLDELHDDGVQVIKLGETFRFVLFSGDLFNADSANFQQPYRPVLKTLAALMKTYDKVNVKVAAYTDNKGSVKRQQALTTRQAQVVASFLWSEGVDARLEYAMGYNRQNAVDWNGNAKGRFYNRRVEISFRYYPRSIPYA